MIPDWIKLTAASKDELLSEIEAVIDEMGGMEAAQKALRELATEKTSNWVSQERFVVAKTIQELMEDYSKGPVTTLAPKKEVAEDERPIKPTPAPEIKTETPEQSKPEKPKRERKPKVKTEPEKLSPAKYLAVLLGLLIGAGGVLTVDQLKKINLEREMAKYRVGNRGQELARQPLALDLPKFEMTEEQYKEELAEFESQVEMRKKEIEDTINPEKKKELEEDLRQFQLSFKALHKTPESEDISEEGEE